MASTAAAALIAVLMACAAPAAAEQDREAASSAAAAPAGDGRGQPSRWDRVNQHLTQGWDQGHWRAVAAPYAPHIRPSDEHSEVWAIGLERQRADQWLAGGSFFSNSFGQPSAYLYLGKRWPSLLGQPQLFGQFSAGMLYGYRGKYQNKVPFNYNGFSPGALASIGWQFNRQASLTIHAVGDAAVMFQFGWDFR